MTHVKIHNNTRCGGMDQVRNLILILINKHYMILAKRKEKGNIKQTFQIKIIVSDKSATIK